MLIFTLCLLSWSKVGDPEPRAGPPAHEVVSAPAPQLAPVATQEVTMLRKVLDNQDATLMALDKINDTVVRMAQAQSQALPPAPEAPAAEAPSPPVVRPPPAAPPKRQGDVSPPVSVLPRYLPTAGEALNRGYHVAVDVNGKYWFGATQHDVDTFVATVPRRPPPVRTQSYSSPVYQPPVYQPAPSYATPAYSSPMTYGSSSCGPGGCGTSGLFGGLFR